MKHRYKQICIYLILICAICIATMIKKNRGDISEKNVSHALNGVEKKYEFGTNNIKPYVDLDHIMMDADIYMDEYLKSEDTKQGKIPNSDEAGTERSDEADAKEAMATENARRLRRENAKKAVDIENPDMSVSATNAILFNSTDDQVLYSKNALKRICPASTTKLLTAIVAVEQCDASSIFIVGDEIDMIATDASRAYLKKGEVLNLESVLDALLLPSGNDAAYVISVNVGRMLAHDETLSAKKANQYFIDAMNQKVNDLGGVDSCFKTPDGYDAEGQYTTAYDMALIGKEAIKSELICKTVKKERARDILVSGEDVTWQNTNKLIKNGSGYYYKYAIGLKTGTSTEAGRCLVSAAQKDGKDYIAVVMNASMEGRWQDSLDLLKYGVELPE